jgi:hypothetical protein
VAIGYVKRKETAMKIKIGPVEVTDLTVDELYVLLDRYAGKTEASPDVTRTVADSTNRPAPGNGSGQSGGHADRVVLEKLVRSGNAGVPTQDLGEILGRRGKAIRGGLHEWAGRVGLIQDVTIDPFEECRAEGTRRGVRLKPSLLPVAERILGNT